MAECIIYVGVAAHLRHGVTKERVYRRISDSIRLARQ